MKIQLKGRAIPRRGGDPAFKILQCEGTPETSTIAQKEGDLDAGVFKAVLDVFTPEEVVELVNRALYQLEYQHNAHRVRGQRQRDAERLLKQKVKELFHVSWMKATTEQVHKAKEALEKEQG